MSKMFHTETRPAFSRLAMAEKGNLTFVKIGSRAMFQDKLGDHCLNRRIQVS